MTALWKKTNDRYESSAKVVDGNLIISLPDAINPIVWRMELGSVKASALEVKQHASEGTFLLSLKTPKGEVHDVAPFDSKEKAVTALMRVSSALQGASGKMTAPAPGIAAAQESSGRSAAGPRGASSYKWLIALGGVIIVIFLFAQLTNMAQQRVESVSDQSASSTDSMTGVPQSADDALRGF